MPERKIGDLADRTGHETFRVVMEWMKENRLAWERHLKTQDKKLEAIHSEVAEIHTEVRTTNGRVTELESAGKLAAALQTGKESWEAGLSQKQEKQFERGSAKRLAIWGTAITAGATIIGGTLGYIGHSAGLW